MTNPMSEAINSLSNFQVYAESVVGYYRILVAGNIPVESAMRMVEEYHTMLVSQTLQVMKHQAAAKK